MTRCSSSPRTPADVSTSTVFSLSRRIESSQYRFILEMTWTMLLRFAFASVVGFTNTLHVSIAFATEWTDLLAWQSRRPSRPEQLAVSSREQSRLGPSTREGLTGRRRRSASFYSPARSFSDQLVQAVPSATISCLCLFVQSNFRPFTILLSSNHPSRVLGTRSSHTHRPAWTPSVQVRRILHSKGVPRRSVRKTPWRR
jgi:hypothetical protein